MLELRNYMEDIVQQKLAGILKKYPNCCTCEKCYRDIMSLALNHLPPRYISTEKGNLYARIDMLSIEYDSDVVEQIAKAVEIVSKNPRHDNSENADS